MIKPDYKIIAVDNDQVEIERIKTAFNNLDILCHTILYDVATTNQIKYTGIRIAFFDINLSIGHNEGPNLYNIVCDALKAIIPTDNGPYALIFWSLHASEVEKLKVYINEREKDNIAPPLIIDTIDKTKSQDPQVLISEIKRVISKGSLETLLDFEQKAQMAASDTVMSIFSLIPNGNFWGDNTKFEENYSKVLSKMAIDAVGYNHAKNEPKESIKSAILPIFEHNLKKIIFDNSWDNPLSLLKDNNKVTYPEKFDIGKLNSVYHIHKSDNFLKNTRGIVVGCEISDDECIKSLTIKRAQILNEFIPFRKGTRLHDKKRLREQTECIFIEISASCDYAQQKIRIPKYVLGLIYPIEIEENIDLNLRPNSFFKTPIFTINDKQYYIGVNFKYILGLNINDERLGQIKFCLSESLTNQISNRYANYTSRIGIISYD